MNRTRASAADGLRDRLAAPTASAAAPTLGLLPEGSPGRSAVQADLWIGRLP